MQKSVRKKVTEELTVCFQFALIQFVRGQNLFGEYLEMSLHEGIARQLGENEQLSKAETTEKSIMFPPHIYMGVA